MRKIKQPIGLFDTYNHGKCVYIDFTYRDRIIVWIEYKRLCKAYLAEGR